MEDVLLPVLIVGMLFIGLPWLILHYLTRWKSNTGISQQDEVLLDELHELARRLDSRIETIERIVADENPTWKDSRIADHSEQRRALK
ncbi:envelope stress response membrane protein PspB [Sandarakinorhabdus sp.]|uniref:envelope stress response membrane protein PspB n=1 Tax=Sandarakinorhabdus sp. TaxID=1916663 RepID=UPI00286D8583|nr:envelope stress response membrane protein PspB [Sandarakinorhabdus sp.]